MSVQDTYAATDAALEKALKSIEGSRNDWPHKAAPVLEFLFQVAKEAAEHSYRTHALWVFANSLVDDAQTELREQRLRGYKARARHRNGQKVTRNGAGVLRRG